MPFTITHPFVSTVSDGGIATKVKPSNWNAPHVITGSLGANEVSNIPAGIITATDVQAALNQLAAAIPAPGPGTDPLALTNGLSVSTHNPTFSGNPTDRYAVAFSMNTDCSTTQPDFCNTEILNLFLNATNGQLTYGPVTQVKESIFGISIFAQHNAAGQRFLYNNRLVSYGMGDVALHGGDNITFGGGPINGDEGQGWGMVSNLSQQNFLSVKTIVSVPTPSIVNTTTTQAITRSKDAQTVSVVGTVGAVNGDWVVIDQEAPTSSPNEEVVQIISFTANSITGIFRCNHLNGATVTPALRLILSDTNDVGQDRILVNFTQPSYSTGTVSLISGGGFTGAGTNWTNNMVGGYALNIGAISLTADDYTGTPFSVPNPLRSWYQISSVVNPTSLGIYRTSIAGDGAYRGKGPGAGAYIIRPYAKILRVVTDVNGSLTREVICETVTTTWSPGDTVECAICPYPDVSGFQYALYAYANGGTLREFMSIRNGGARTFDNVFRIWDAGPIGSDPTADTVTFTTVLNIDTQCTQGIFINAHPSMISAIRLRGAFAGGGLADSGGRISWGTSTLGAYIGINSPRSALEFQTSLTSTDERGFLRFAGPGADINPGGSSPQVMQWCGWIHSTVIPGANPGYIAVDKLTGTVDYERAFFSRWFDDLVTGVTTSRIGTEAGGTGSVRDLALQTGSIDRIRFDALGNTVLGTGAIPTNSTDGFLYAVSGAGAPTGVPRGLGGGAIYDGRVPIYIDTTNSQLWLYIGGSWKQPKTPAGAALVTWQ